MFIPQSARINCRGDFTNVEEANTSNTKCLESFQAMLHVSNKCIHVINNQFIKFHIMTIISLVYHI